MRRHQVLITISLLTAVACGGGQTPAPAAPEASSAAGGETTPVEAPLATGAPNEGSAGAPDAGPSESSEFVLNTAAGAKPAQTKSTSKLKPTRTEAVVKFYVVDKEKGPVWAVVISLTAPDGKKYYTEETNSEGFTELLVPVGQKYELAYLSLAQRDIAASVTVTDEPNQNIKLTLRYKRYTPPPKAAPEPRFVLDGVTFATGKATISDESFPRLDGVVEYLTYKKSSRIEISGHTDNQGNPKANRTLSEKRAQACRDYLISKGIDGSRIEAHGFGDERPIASNDDEEGRRVNRRIEATELSQ
jgi:outer membrane protein OmpA-like peptidoglycan-associated protein